LACAGAILGSKTIVTENTLSNRPAWVENPPARPNFDVERLAALQTHERALVRTLARGPAGTGKNEETPWK